MLDIRFEVEWDCLTLNGSCLIRPGCVQILTDASVEKGLHFGQRKLLLSEIEFLTSIGDVTDAIVVYAGAANGSHLPFLFSLFPATKFVLIDPAPFCDALVDADRRKSSTQLLELINDCCSDELCLRIRKTYPTHSLYLISDIRSGNPPDRSNWENTQLMERDSAMQANNFTLTTLE